jgi:2-C-methyl-D-erythritol 4-phosphate cytidylyltransferase
MTNTSSAVKYWAIVPAAGKGMRMGGKKPKQYLTVAGKTIIEHSLAPLLNNNRIHKIVLVLAENDSYWRTLPLAEHSKIIVVFGGAERCHSVFNGVEALQTYAYDQDWVLVHDAARPLLSNDDLEKLILETQDDPIGGLLGVPIHATIKLVSDDNHVLETIPRSHLWRAFTPQIFRYGVLMEALTKTLPDNPTSDCAKAVEQLGHSPLMVEGRGDNIKVTRPTDITWVARLLQSSGEY